MVLGVERKVQDSCRDLFDRLLDRERASREEEEKWRDRRLTHGLLESSLGPMELVSELLVVCTGSRKRQA